jgi:hypothetical protein
LSRRPLPRLAPRLPPSGPRLASPGPGARRISRPRFGRLWRSASSGASGRHEGGFFWVCLTY